MKATNALIIRIVMPNIAKNTNKNTSKDIKNFPIPTNNPSDNVHVTRAVKNATPIETKKQSNETDEDNATI